MELMNMKVIRTTILIMLSLSVMSLWAQTSVWNGDRKLWNNGSGTSSDPYIIESAENLAFLAYMVNKGYDTKDLYFRLITDIDLAGNMNNYWEPIGLGNRWPDEDGCDRGIVESGTSFRGHFDGGGHGISNIYVDDIYTYSGLFGRVSGQNNSPAIIENVCIVSGTIKGINCGGIAGNGSLALISNCMNSASVEGDTVGGIVGVNAFEIHQCHNAGNVTGSIAGGIVGEEAHIIEECYNNGNIVCTNRIAGGILGLATDVTIKNCYNTGHISGVGNIFDDFPIAGGIIGFTSNAINMSNSYNVGEISSTNLMGCLLGHITNGSTKVTNCHYLNTCQSEYGTSQSEVFMQSMEFVNILNSQNPKLVWAWDTNNANNGYPILSKEIYSIVTIASPSDGGIVGGSGTYAYGANCIVTANADSHYCFICWKENDETVSTDSCYSFIVAENRTLYAEFVNCDDINENSTSVKIFPNPAKDYIFIIGAGINHVMVYNTFGQIIDEYYVEELNQMYIDLRRYPSGIYILKANLKNCNALIKFIKQ